MYLLNYNHYQFNNSLILKLYQINKKDLKLIQLW